MAKTAGIILIGNEILSGKVVDANASYLCRELRALGVEVRRIAVIPDEVDLIAQEVAAHSAAFDVVFTSGGVGPDPRRRHHGGRGARRRRRRRTRSAAGADARELSQGASSTRRGSRWRRCPRAPSSSSGAELIFPAVVIRNIHVLPGVPEIFRRKFDALRERFRDAPFHLCSVFVNMAEGTLADHLNALLVRHPELMLGSYPEFFNAEYKVKVTLESKDRAYVERAVEDLLGGLPALAVVRVER